MANIKDIAKAAGVSVSTVSRVLNGHAYVNEEKRKKVHEAIERLNYSRNMNAVHLVKGKTNIVGVVLPDLTQTYFVQLLEGISQGALQQNYQLLLFQTNYNSQGDMKALEMLKVKQVDGIILCSKSVRWDQIEPYTKYGPIVACEETEIPSISSVYIDHYDCFREGLRYLMAKGHRFIGYCLGRPDSNNSRKRRKAYLDALAMLNEPLREEWLFNECYVMEDGVEVVHKLLRLENRPKALLVTCDQIAIGIIAEARRNKIKVPEDLAVIGFDNQAISKVFDLTTIDNHLPEMGATSFRMVYDQITNKTKGSENWAVNYNLIERKTV